jgi:hypothetical protein
LEEWGPCPIFAGFTLVFALQLRKRDGKTSVRIVEECQLALMGNIFRLKDQKLSSVEITIKISNIM